jgi:hypothetical protein
MSPKRRREEAVVLTAADLCCPITHDLMFDPVVASDGHTYERVALRLWLFKGKRSSPATGLPLRRRFVVTNHFMRGQTARLLDLSPELRPVRPEIDDPLFRAMCARANKWCGSRQDWEAGMHGDSEEDVMHMLLHHVRDGMNPDLLGQALDTVATMVASPLPEMKTAAIATRVPEFALSVIESSEDHVANLLAMKILSMLSQQLPEGMQERILRQATKSSSFLTDEATMRRTCELLEATLGDRDTAQGVGVMWDVLDRLASCTDPASFGNALVTMARCMRTEQLPRLEEVLLARLKAASSPAPQAQLLAGLAEAVKRPRDRTDMKLKDVVPLLEVSHSGNKQVKAAALEVLRAMNLVQ